ncbi:MAG: DUF268 domain-containing protein [Chitinophagaceae bacterium]
MADFIKGTWRLFQPVKNYFFKYPVRIWGSYARFLKSWKQYKKMGGKAGFRYIAPYFSFEDTQTGGGHYFYQDVWALRHLAAINPAMHYDIGSRYDGFVGQATAICSVTSIDIRPPAFTLPGLHFQQGDILQLPFADNSLSSLSCLHTIEHIGLGRYGDAINPQGFEQSLAQLQRVVAPGGHLLLSMPVGRERTEFNAQRVLDPLTCVRQLTQMDLAEFSIVTEQNIFIEKTDPAEYTAAGYCCGLYLFKKRM